MGMSFLRHRHDLACLHYVSRQRLQCRVTRQGGSGHAMSG